ncbi:MAG: xanthine dehydrogenase family protein molybdopterin-binding subunit, partial [Chloroflexota bacterium]
MTAQTGIGARVKRKEDQRFLTDTGRYVDDLPLARATYAQFVRSPHAHAKIKSIDASKALKLAGVKAVVTRDDLPDKTDGDAMLYDVLVNVMAREKALYQG